MFCRLGMFCWLGLFLFIEMCVVSFPSTQKGDRPKTWSPQSRKRKFVLEHTNDMPRLENVIVCFLACSTGQLKNCLLSVESMICKCWRIIVFIHIAFIINKWFKKTYLGIWTPSSLVYWCIRPQLAQPQPPFPASSKRCHVSRLTRSITHGFPAV